MSSWEDGGREKRVEQGQVGPQLDEQSEQQSLHDLRRNVAASKRIVSRKADRAESSARASIPESGGTPLPSSQRSRMEKHLGADLSAVKVHTGGESAQAAKQLGARAFTTGQDVHFAAGQFSPGTREGDHLLAHELTHTIQGGAAPISRKKDEAEGGEAEGKEQEHEVSQPGDAAETEADSVADDVTSKLHGDKKKEQEKGKAKDKAKGKKGKEGEQAAAEAEDKEGGAEATEDHAHDADKGGGDDDKPAGGGDKPAGGGVKAGASKGEGDKPKIAAKLENVARKVYLATGGPPPPPRVVPPFHGQVDSELSALKGASSLSAYAGAVQAANTLVNPASKAKVATRVSRLMNSYARALPVWQHLPPVDGKPAIEAYWSSRMAKVDGLLAGKISDRATAAATALKASDTMVDGKRMDAERVFNDVIAGSGFSVNAPETSADDHTIEQSGGVAKCFDVGDFFWKMDAAKRAQWCAELGKDEGAAHQDFVAQCISTQKPPLAPPGKESHPAWAGMSAEQLYTARLTGFVGQGKDAAAVGSYDQAIKTFALNKGYYPSNHMFIVSAGADAVKAQVKSGSMKLGKPSIFCHLEFEEFLYAENDQKMGELAKMNPDGSAQENHNGVKEMSCVGLASEIWSSGKFV